MTPMELLIYLAKLSAYWIALYGLYTLFLHRQTFLRWNRAYLLGSLVLSFALPLVQYPQAAPPLPVVYQVSMVPFTVVGEVPSPSLLTWENLLWLVYGLGVLVMLVRLAGKFLHLFSFLQKGDRIPMEGYTLVLLDDNTAGSFSFMKWVFISPTDYARNFDTILTHELVHVRQRHSWDILLVEILQVVFWFNPILVIYKKTLQQVHEFLADSKAVNNNRDAYAEFLVSYAQNALDGPTLGVPTTFLTNQFFNSKLLKNRITMLYKTKNSNWSLGKYAGVALIVGFSSLMVASCERDVMPTTKDSGEKNFIGKVNVEGVIVGPDNKPIPGVNVIVKGKETGTTTDANGKFSMVAPGGSKLAVSFPGLYSIDLAISPSYKNTKFDIKLTPNSAKAAETINSTISSVPAADGQSVKVTVQPSMINGETIFTVVEKNPEYPGGIQEMFKFLGENIKYPEAAAKANVQGKVFLSFVVTTEGVIKDVQILKGLGFGADEESIRVLSKMPRWTPGMQSGRAVNVRYNLPIAFQLDKDGSKKVGIAPPAPPRELIEWVNADKSKFQLPTGPKQPLIMLDGKEIGNANPRPVFNSDLVKGMKLLSEADARGIYGERGAYGVVELSTKKMGVIDQSTPAGRPIFIIDGVDKGADFSVAKMDKESIKLINILKGQKATDKYGTKGTNGVVEITTKK